MKYFDGMGRDVTTEVESLQKTIDEKTEKVKVLSQEMVVLIDSHTAEIKKLSDEISELKSRQKTKVVREIIEEVKSEDVNREEGLAESRKRREPDYSEP